jgi:hypothetical protein
MKAFQMVTMGLVLGAFGSVGCAANESAAVGPKAGGETATGGGSPLCHVAGPSEVVASHVYVPAGVEAQPGAGGVRIRFAHRKAQCFEAGVLAMSGARVGGETPGECPGAAGDVVATSGSETMLARQASSGSRPYVELGVVVYDAPRNVFGFRAGHGDQVVPRIFAPPEVTPGGETDPGLVPLPGGRFLLTWADRTTESRSLHAQPVAGWGEPAGPALDLSPSDVSVIGQASTVVDPDGRGLVAYLASSDSGFDVRVTPIACDAK